jgi:acyl-coenzyme A thioesterase PaaI-like protein
MIIEAIQDFYPDDIAVCYGCGKNNAHGLHIRTAWDGKEGTFKFKPEPYHTAFPGVVYGGLIASLIDCHSIGTAIAASYQAEDRAPGTEPEIMYVTGKLNVSFVKPTPTGKELLLKAQVKELTEKKAIVTCSMYVEGEICAQGEVVTVRVASRRDGVHTKPIGAKVEDAPDPRRPRAKP